MSFTIWFTGLSGAGKSTLSRLIYFQIRHHGLSAELLDGDIIRSNFSQELGFSKHDRDINVRRIGFVSHLLNKHGVVSVVAAIAPYRTSRDINRKLIANYHEIHVQCDIKALIQRDPKGLYAKALAGEIKNFTGISDPYEEPNRPELRVETHCQTQDESLSSILRYLKSKGLIGGKLDDHHGDTLEALVNEDAAWRLRLAQLGFVRDRK